MAILSRESIDAGLESLNDWRDDGSSIVREIRCKDFVDAIGFVTRVALVAQTRDHHPDIDIRWNKVTISLSTHSDGALTHKDTDLARAIEGL